MNKDPYLQNIEKKLEGSARQYSIQRNVLSGGRRLDLFAASNSMPKIPFLGVCSEFCYFYYAAVANRETVYDFCNYLIDASRTLHDPNLDNATVFITGVLIAGETADRAERATERFTYQNMGFLARSHRYVIRLLLTDLTSETLFSNRAGRHLVRFYNIFEVPVSSLP